MEKPTLIDIARACKLRADELQAQSNTANVPLKRGAALEQAARELGYRDWNAASAATKTAQPAAHSPVMPTWRNLDAMLPSLPLRIHRAGSSFYRSIQELMRWAHALEGTARLDSSIARREALAVSGGQLPYVLVSDYGRWGDDVFRLCDRGYDDWPGIAFTRDELTLAGIFDWHEQYGSHDGDTMLSVMCDEVVNDAGITVLRGLARTLAAIALIADQGFVRQDGEALPQGKGFTIDLADPSQLTAKRVARLIGCRDDSQHRQLRVTVEGIAYLSDVVAMTDLENLSFRLETWTVGTGYVGKRAADDDGWVDQVLRDLRENWSEPGADIINF